MTVGNHTVAMTESHGGAQPELSPFDPHSAEFWVYAGLTIFLLLAIFVAKAPKRITEALDARIAETKRQLDEASRLRAEAEALLADAKERNAASAGDAAAIVSHAESEAKALLAKAEADVAELIFRRQKMAEDKIAATERGAIAEVRATAANAAAKAAALIIADTHGAAADKPLIDRTIAGLNRPI